MLLCVRTQMSNKHLQKTHGFDEKKYRKHIDLMEKKKDLSSKKKLGKENFLDTYHCHNINAK